MGGLLAYAEKIVASHRAFVNCFLVAATFGKRNSFETAHVAKLGHLGDDAGFYFLQQVSEYAGIINGPTLGFARRVERGLLERNTICAQRTQQI